MIIVTGFALLILWVSNVPVTQAQNSTQIFPDSHKDFLGAGSFGALFGVNPNSLSPGPSSSDPGTGRPPRVGPNARVNAPQSPFPFGLLGRSETTIASGGNGNFLVAGWNDAQGFCGFPFGGACTPPATPGIAGFGFSHDGGDTWTDGRAPFVFGASVITRSDPSLDIGGHGNDTFYYANLAVFGANPFVSTAGVSVHRGSFKGQDFSWDDATLLQVPNFPRDFVDKDLLAAEKNRSNVYVSYTNFIEVSGIPQFGFGQIEAFSSTNGGQTYSRSIIQPDETTSVPFNSGIVNQGSAPAVGPDGTVYVTWERGWLWPFTGSSVTPEIRVAKSTNNGATWTPAAPVGPAPHAAGVLVSKICSQAFFPPFGYNRGTTNDFPRIAVAETGPNRGRVYVTYSDCAVANGGPSRPGFIGNRDTDVYVRFSDDQGATWSAPVLVAGGPHAQFFPTVSVEPGGNVDVVYYDAVQVPAALGPPAVPSTSLTDVFWAQSIDGGATFQTPIRVSTVTTNWRTTVSNIAPNFGDYITAVSGGNKIFASWADGRNGVPDVVFSRIDAIGKAPR